MDTKGKFSVKKVSWMLYEDNLMISDSRVLKIVWRLNVPPKVPRLFLWLVIHDSITTECFLGKGVLSAKRIYSFAAGAGWSRRRHLTCLLIVPPSSMKLSLDGAWKFGAKKAGVGGVLRDYGLILQMLNLGSLILQWNVFHDMDSFCNTITRVDFIHTCNFFVDNLAKLGRSKENEFLAWF
ncbi:hypothetical protein GOBAR_AA06428 [Gossypium barbadense]|uniref:Uncharacterized protein n=1 Tax=Gossypium barbadense TaxID=3634 RepID=A0A2P5YEZ8_GOSBA|nr:hypothetical protein GOBAR_AA06428 [Gossypium barbadense]